MRRTNFGEPRPATFAQITEALLEIDLLSDDAQAIIQDSRDAMAPYTGWTAQPGTLGRQRPPDKSPLPRHPRERPNVRLRLDDGRRVPHGALVGDGQDRRRVARLFGLDGERPHAATRVDGHRREPRARPTQTDRPADSNSTT